jgi:hypothetical protein
MTRNELHAQALNVIAEMQEINSQINNMGGDLKNTFQSFLQLTCYFNKDMTTQQRPRQS